MRGVSGRVAGRGDLRLAVLVGLAAGIAGIMPGTAGGQATETPGDAGFVLTGGRNAAGLGLVRVFADNDANDTYETLADELIPYATTSSDGIRVAAGDFDGDGNDELVTASDANAPVKVYALDSSGAPGAMLDSVPGFSEGTFVAAGDFNGDEVDELVLSADPGGEPKVRIHSDVNLDGDLGEVIAGFNAYPAAGNNGGVRVATANTDNDFDDELITGPGPDPGLPVKIWDDTDLDRNVADNPIDDSFVPYTAGFAGGTFVAGGPIENVGNGGGDVIVAPASGANNVVIRTDTDADGDVSDNPPFEELPPPWGASFTSGVRVAAGDTDGSGTFVEVITAPGASSSSKNVKIYDDNADVGAFLRDNPVDHAFDAFPGSFGTYVAFARVFAAEYSQSQPQAIPDDGTRVSRVTVPGSAGIVRDVNVSLNISHTFAGDLDVTLTHASNTVELFTNVGGSDAGFQVSLDDEAGTDIGVANTPDDTPVVGAFNPEDAALLSVFDGLDASGRWTLTVVDNSEADVGTLHSWGLRITY